MAANDAEAWPPAPPATVLLLAWEPLRPPEPPTAVTETAVVLAGAVVVSTVPHAPAGDQVWVVTVGAAVVVVVGAVVVVWPGRVVLVVVGAVVVVVVAAASIVVDVSVVSGVLALHDTENEPAAVSV